MSKALLIIDVQNDYFEGGKCELFEPLKALVNIEKILGIFRKENLPIIHIQHINITPKATFFVPNTFGVEIHKNLTPKEGEFHITKNYPNSFLKTGLLDVLKKNDITELVVCGMMSHMCVDTTVRACIDYGLSVTLLQDACTTKNLIFDNKTILATTVHETFMASLNGMFANVIKTDKFIEKWK
jgi:nicotinamidase-related amidase